MNDDGSSDLRREEESRWSSSDNPPADRQQAALVFAWRNPWVRAVVYVGLIVLLFVVLYRARSGYTFALQ